MNEIERDLLKSLYWGNQYSEFDIAKIFNCSRGSIQYKMYIFNIPHRSRSEAQKLRTTGYNGGFKKGVKHPREWVIKSIQNNHRKYPRGKEHPNWIEDRSKVKESLNDQIRGSNDMDKWRKCIFERDLYTCQICHEKGGLLNAHHIKAFADYPEDRFNTSNGITLCSYCHRYAHNVGSNPLNEQ